MDCTHESFDWHNNLPSKLEYIEWQLWEFKKFKTMPIITQVEIDAVDVNDLLNRLQSDCREKHGEET